MYLQFALEKITHTNVRMYHNGVLMNFRFPVSLVIQHRLA